MKTLQLIICCIIVNITAAQKIDSQGNPCEDVVDCNDNSNEWFVFVGKKIKTKKADINYCEEPLLHYNRFKSKYQILSPIFGSYPDDVIDFLSFEHFVIYNYYDFEYALLFLRKSCGEYVVASYAPIFETKDGQMASPHNYRLYIDADSSVGIHPHPIDFIISRKHQKLINYTVSADTSTPYYTFKKELAIPKYGNYPKEVYNVMKGLFKKQGIIIE